jgi:hypothetical protein
VVQLSGELVYKAGVLGNGSVPLKVEATADVALATERKARKFVVTAHTERVRKVSIELVGLPKGLASLAEEPVRKWADDELSKLEPSPLTELSGGELPIRELRVAPEATGLRIELLTGAVKPGTVALGAPKSGSDWQLDVATQSLVWLARTASFEAGPQSSFEVVAVPEALSVTRDAFTLDLRLWRTSGTGWWRDYRVTGKVRIEDGRAVLEPAKAEQRGASPGAGLADPLALLAEGVIVDTIATALEQSVPAGGSQTIDGVKADVTVERVHGSGDVISVAGELQLTP